MQRSGCATKPFQVDLDAITVRENQLNNLVQLWTALGGGWNDVELAGRPPCPGCAADTRRNERPQRPR